MVPVPQYAKPVLSNGWVLLPYKTKKDLICNRFFGENFDISGHCQNASVFVRVGDLTRYAERG
jgi:hypothetical protein